MSLRVSHTPCPGDRVPACQKFLECLYVSANGMRNSNQILLRDQTILENSFTGSTMPPALAKNVCNTNADARSFAVANILVIFVTTLYNFERSYSQKRF